jgi:hypothetical protein
VKKELEDKIIKDLVSMLLRSDDDIMTFKFNGCGWSENTVVSKAPHWSFSDYLYSTYGLSTNDSIMLWRKWKPFIREKHLLIDLAFTYLEP